ncbi:hypothetical protein PV325_006993 [Microctonus aethiopoides]|nr:hypothetical protein PV325_006993 [Microctonus aethiopoides]
MIGNAANRYNGNTPNGFDGICFGGNASGKGDRIERTTGVFPSLDRHQETTLHTDPLQVMADDHTILRYQSLSFTGGRCNSPQRASVKREGERGRDRVGQQGSKVSLRAFLPIY